MLIDRRRLRQGEELRARQDGEQLFVGVGVAVALGVADRHVNAKAPKRAKLAAQS